MELDKPKVRPQGSRVEANGCPFLQPYSDVTSIRQWNRLHTYILGKRNSTRSAAFQGSKRNRGFNPSFCVDTRMMVKMVKRQHFFVSGGVFGLFFDASLRIVTSRVCTCHLRRIIRSAVLFAVRYQMSRNCKPIVHGTLSKNKSKSPVYFTSYPLELLPNSIVPMLKRTLWE